MRSLRVEKSATTRTAEIVLVGPGRGNALGPDFWVECPRVFDELDADPEVRAIVVRGDGDHFTYGLDLKAMIPELAPYLSGDNLARGRTDFLALVRRMQAACDAVERCRKPVIAAIHGYCLGGGVDLAAACDVRIASADALFSIREVKVAMVADMGSLQRLPRIIGQGHTRELAFTGDDITAERALRIGLVNDVLPDREATLGHARDMATRIAANPPLVVQGIKEVLDFCDGKSVRDGERFVAVWNSAFLASKDLMEAVAAFTEKRPPTFRGD